MTRVADLPGRWSSEPYLRGERGDRGVLLVGCDDEALVGVVHSSRRGAGVLGLGAPRALARLLVRQRAALAETGPAFCTVERGTAPHLDQVTLAALGIGPGAAGSHWDWLWTPSPLRAGHDDVVRLDLGPTSAAQVTDCLARAHPDASTGPDDPRVVAWWGVPDPAAPTRLLGVVGAMQVSSGLPPHLVSLGVDPAARGRGLAGSLLAAAVDDGLRVRPAHGAPMVSLGVYAANEAALRVYHRLGFVTAHRFTSFTRDPLPWP